MKRNECNKERSNSNTNNNNRNRRRTGRGRKPMSNKKTVEAYSKGKEDENGSMGSDRNDPSWYTSGMIAQASSNLFFAKRFGDPIQDVLPDDVQTQLGWTNKVIDYALPGIMSFQTVTSFGEFTNNQDSPLNIASQALYSYIRHENSGSRNYDSPDLMEYVLALVELYGFIVYCQRVYGFMNTYYPQNAYMAQRLVQAMGVNFNDLLGNSAQFCFFINTLISKATAFALPADFSYINRKVFMYQNVFIESDNIKDQMYLFVPEGFYKYTVDSGHPEAYLKYQQLWQGSNALTISTLMAYGNMLVQALLDQEDAGIISGDIIKAYGAGNLIKLAEMPLNYALSPIVGDEYIMYQIRNATIVPTYTYPDLYQDSTKLFLEFHPQARVTATSWTATTNAARIYLHKGNKLLTSNKIDPTPEDVMESTRLMVQFKNFNSDGTVVSADVISGSEIIVRAYAWRTYLDPNNNLITMVGDQYDSNYAIASNSGFGQRVAALSGFRFHPTMYVFSGAYTSSSCEYQGFIQECESITTVDSDELKSIHQAAWLNMIAVPSIAKLR